MFSELKSICSNNPPSMLQETSAASFQKFSWDLVWREVVLKAPTLVSLIQCGLPRKANCDPKPVICMCIAMLAKYRNPHVCHVQSAISLILYAGHASTQVFCRLQKCMLTIHPSVLLKLLDKLGSSHDEVVTNWREKLMSRVHIEEVSPSLPSFALPSYDTSIDSECDGVTPTSLNEYCEVLPMESSLQPCFASSPLPSPGKYDDSLSLTCLSPVLEASCEPVIDAAKWFGFKVVGDNIDKTVRPRHETMKSHNQSLHYFQSYAVRDRVDLSALSDEPTQVDLHSFSAEALLPSKQDLKQILQNFAVLITRIFLGYLPCFKSFSAVVVKHIPHIFSSEMSTKSEVVPLGVFLKNENKLEEMVDIMESLQKYVPHKRRRVRVDIPGVGQESVNSDVFFPTLFGGDQLTVARAVGAQRIRANSEDGVSRLEGLVPVVEDWHAKVCFLGVIWKRLYRESSSMDGGTLHQLRNLINRRNIPAVPKNDVNVCEDFLTVVGISHILSATLEVMGVECIESSAAFSGMPSELQQNAINDLARKVIEKHTNLHLLGAEHTIATGDGILDYSREVLTLSLLYAEFHDAIKEGDGNRVLRCWKFFLLFFKASNRTNYSVEAVNLLAQFYILLPPRLAQQLLWSRFINTQGVEGGNIPMDLHMEHLNRSCKTSVANLGANTTPTAIVRIGKCIGPLMDLGIAFDHSTGITRKSGRHSDADTEADIEKIVDELTRKSKVFQFVPGRKHNAFSNFSGSLLDTLNKDRILDWIKHRLLQMKKKF